MEQDFACHHHERVVSQGYRSVDLGNRKMKYSMSKCIYFSENIWRNYHLGKVSGVLRRKKSKNIVSGKVTLLYKRGR